MSSIWLAGLVNTGTTTGGLTLPRHDQGPPPPQGGRDPSGPHPLGPGPRPDRRPAVWALSPAITRDDIPGLCEQLLALLRDSGAAVVRCDVSAIVHPDIVTVEALARLLLTARHNGRGLELRHTGCHLRELLVLTGLHSVLAPDDAPDDEQLGLQVWRQPEQREQPLRVQEGVEPGDPPP
jgi:ABC-type transporter Mla MlaB component